MDHVCAPVVATSEFSLLYYQRYLCISVNALAKKSRLISPAFVLSSPPQNHSARKLKLIYLGRLLIHYLCSNNLAITSTNKK